jgi:zinc/manganese transport system permease protein
VIFVDLALATIAAFGAVWGALLGWDIAQDRWAIKGFSLAFTFVGAAIFSVTRMRHERVPHEAIIGITYAVALAAILLASAKLPHGAEEVRDLQAGSILWVRGPIILETSLIYAAVGLFHWIFRARFLAISLDPEGAEASGIDVRVWDFLFYVSLGFVVTSSVSIAGVLLVFSYLVIPAVIAVLFAEGIGARLVIGWTVGTLVSVLGLTTSYYEDLPSGPAIVVWFGIVLAGAGVLHYVRGSAHTGRALGRVALGAVAIAAFVGGSRLFRKHEDVDIVHLLEDGVKSERLLALLSVEARPELWERVLPLVPGLLASADVEVRAKLLDLIESRHASELRTEVEALLTDADDLVREQAVHCVLVLGDRESAAPLLAAARIEEDESIKVEMAEAALELGERGGIDVLLDVMANGEAALARRDALEHLRAHVDTPLPYDASGSAAARAREVEALRSWWETDGNGVELR